MTASYFDIIKREIICQKQNNTITIAINGQRKIVKMGTNFSSDTTYCSPVK
jgi:hypothetical protein